MRLSGGAATTAVSTGAGVEEDAAASDAGSACAGRRAGKRRRVRSTADTGRGAAIALVLGQAGRAAGRAGGGLERRERREEAARG